MVSRFGAANGRTLLFILFGNMLFGFTIGLPAVSVMGIIGIVVTAMWHQSEDAAKLQQWEKEAELRKKIEELEKQAKEKRLEEENGDFILKYGIKKLPSGRFEVASPEEQAAVGRKPVG